MDPYVGEIRLFAGKYAPAGWLFCEGQTLEVPQYQVLFAVISNVFGGDGTTTFALPDLRGLVPIHQGQGDGLTTRNYRASGGTKQETLTMEQIPNHDHAARCRTNTNGNDPIGSIWAVARNPINNSTVSFYSNKADTPMNPEMLTPIGGGQAHNNMQPYMALNYIIACEGVFPVKS
jgi:microcystin-dependent protein